MRVLGMTLFKLPPLFELSGKSMIALAVLPPSTPPFSFVATVTEAAAAAAAAAAFAEFKLEVELLLRVFSELER